MSQGTKRASTETSLSSIKSKAPKLEKGLSVRLRQIIDKKYEKLTKALDSNFQRIFQTMKTMKNEIINELSNMSEEMQNKSNRVSTLEKDVKSSNNLESEPNRLKFFKIMQYHQSLVY